MAIRSWFDLRRLPVMIPSEGRRVGTLLDFYYKLEVNSVYALRVKVGVLGNRALTANAISSITRDAINIASDMMLIDESNDGQLSQLPMSNSLLSSKVKSESGRELGNVSDILMDTDPPVALRIAAFQLDGGKTFSANEVTHYSGGEILILDKAAKRLP
jgi:uncharacterized protein YrrD